MAGLYPVFQVPAILEETQKNEGIYKGSAYFDFEQGDFRLDGGGRMVPSSGFDAWKQWCVKTIATQRGAFCHYTSGLGIDGEQAMAQQTDALQQAALEATIKEALLADPYGRTVDVRDFAWSCSADSLHMGCTIVGQDDCTARIEYDMPTAGRSDNPWRRS